MLWSLEKYISDATAGEDHAGQNVKTKTETLKAFDAAIGDEYFWHYLVPCWMPAGYMSPDGAGVSQLVQWKWKNEWMNEWNEWMNE